MEIKTINRCPKCQSEEIGYVIDIFKKPTHKKYYTGECHCKKCKHKFDRKDIIEKKWVPLSDLEVSRMYDEQKKPVWGINMSKSKELTEELYALSNSRHSGTDNKNLTSIPSEHSMASPSSSSEN